MGDLGMLELLVIIAVVLLLFGGSRLPEVGRSLGGAIRGFKSGLKRADTEPPKKEIPEKLD
jgi:sec-independent protein translocase protein TatA